MAAGLLEGTINFPVEYTKAQLQVGTRFNTPLDVVRATIKDRGCVPVFLSFIFVLEIYIDILTKVCARSNCSTIDMLGVVSG